MLGKDDDHDDDDDDEDVDVVMATSNGINHCSSSIRRRIADAIIS